MQNLVSFLGIFVFIALAWTLSENRNRFPWHVVLWGIALQFAFAILVLWWQPGTRFFMHLNDVFNALLEFSKQGAAFVFGALGSAATGDTPISLQEYLARLGAGSQDPVIQNAIRTGTVPGVFLAFQVLTTIIFFSALLSVLYYLGLMQKLVMLFARLMAYTMRVSGAEALSNSANIFVGQTEAPLVVRPFIEKMTRSELMAIMVGGFANTAGGVLGAYILMLQGYFPNIAAHLISASVLSAPAAFIVAKIMVPETEDPLTMGDLRMDVPIEDANILDAAANGSTVGWQLAINVAAMLISFIALIAMVNLGIGYIGQFFLNTTALIQLDLFVGIALLTFFALQEKIKLSEMTMWWSLAIVALVYALAAAALPPDAARYVGLLGMGVWLPILVVSARRQSLGTGVLMLMAGALIVSNLAYMLAGPLPLDTKLSMQLLLGWLHWPVAFIMGTPAKDCLAVGKLLGEKLILTEFVAYSDLAANLAAATRGEIPRMDPRSIVLVSYALSGFSNFASIAIQIGGISPLAPSRRHDIARLGLKAMIGGALASFILSSVAGTFYTGVSMLGIR
jgi:nucleoside transporter